MDQSGRLIIGYHGCEEKFAHKLLLGQKKISEWRPSNNRYDWLGQGIYFWEHSPDRALRWAEFMQPKRQTVIGSYIQLGKCFDLLNESITMLLKKTYEEARKAFADSHEPMPENHGKSKDRRYRDLDSYIINKCLEDMRVEGKTWDTVRGAFLEGKPVYPGAGFSIESHIQIAVRNSACILGVFQPNIRL